MTIFLKLTQQIVRLFPSELLVRIIYKVLLFKGYRKQVINKNFISTIGSDLSNEAFDDFFKKCLYNISRVIVETVQFNKKHSSSLLYKDISKLEKQCIEGNGLILMASHFGNWELACINLPLHTSIPCYGVYKPLKNKSIDKELLKLRSKFGLKLIPMNAIARSMATNNQQKKPAIYILIADQNPRSIQNVVWVKFLGIMSAFSSGVIKLQNKYDFPIAYMQTTPGKQTFKYTIDFDFYDPASKVSSLEWYSQCLENQIKESPQFWLWSHKRWKRKYTPS